MQHEIEKSSSDWAKLYLEYKILHAGATDMLLQFVCDLNARKLKDIAEAFIEKRKALIKKHGTEKEDGSTVVEEFLNKTKKKKDGEEVKEVSEKVPNPAFEAFTKEIKEVSDHKTSVKIDLIELELFKGQNPRDFANLFMQVGAELGVYNFSEIYTVTDRELVPEAKQ